jgi:hypothetical protein
MNSFEPVAGQASWRDADDANNACLAAGIPAIKTLPTFAKLMILNRAGKPGAVLENQTSAEAHRALTRYLKTDPLCIDDFGMKHFCLGPIQCASILMSISCAYKSTERQTRPTMRGERPARCLPSRGTRKGDRSQSGKFTKSSNSN